MAGQAAGDAALLLANELRAAPPEFEFEDAVNLLKRFCQAKQAQAARSFSLVSASAHQPLRISLSSECLQRVVLWADRVFEVLPRFACALVRSPVSPFDGADDVVTVEVLALEAWTHQVRSYFVEDGTERVTGAECTGSIVLSCGSMASEVFAEFCTEFHKLLAAATTKMKLPFTPGVVAGVVKQAVRVVTERAAGDPEASEPAFIHARTGFTDAKHLAAQEGAMARAFLREVARHALTEEPGDFSVAQSRSDLGTGLLQVEMCAWVLERHVAEIELEEQVDVADLDVAAGLLRRIAADCSGLSSQGLSVEGVDACCLSIKERLDSLQRLHWDEEANEYQLPELVSVAQSPEDHVRPPAVQLTPLSEECPAVSVRNTAIVAQRCDNVPLLSDAADFATLNAFKSLFPLSKDSELLILAAVERVFWSKCTSCLEARGALPLSEIDEMSRAQTWYRSVLHGVLSCESTFSSRALSIGVAYLRSKEMLVVWAAACLTHRACEANTGPWNGGLELFRLPIAAKELQYLVLRSAAEVDAMKTVASYLERCSCRTGGAIFDSSALKTLATGVVKRHAGLRQLCQAIRAADDSRVQRRWDAVQEQKRQLELLRAELAEKECEANSFHKFQKAARRLEKSIAETRRRIADQDVPPAPVYMSLPSKDAEANVVVLFLSCPAPLAQLFSLLFEAQDMLLPREPKSPTTNAFSLGVFEAPCGNNGTTWVDYVNSHRARSAHTGHVYLSWSRSDQRPRRWGPSTVSWYTSKDDGVWWPDECSKRLCWVQGRDPFFGSAKERMTAEVYTEALPQGIFKPLQWAMYVSTSDELDLTRSNKWIADQARLRQVSGFDKKALQAFTCLRAGPRQQHRRVCSLLREDLLCLTNKAVRTLLRQAMHNVGPVTRKYQDLVWHFDSELHGLRDVLMRVVAEKVDTLRDLMREADSALIISDLCSYITEWEAGDDAQELAESAEEMCWSWAVSARNDREAMESASAVDNRQHRSMRCREGVFAGYAVLCCRKTKDITAEEAGRLLRYLVRLRLSASFADGDASKLASVDAECLHNMAQAIPHVTHILGNQHLTEALQEAYPKVPSDLTWKRHGTVFIAQNPDSGVLYAINVHNGHVLVDGFPLHSLPAEVLQSSLYEWTFGNKDFEVVREGNCWRTPRPHEGFSYAFSLKEEGGVSIVETDENLQTDLELADPNSSAFSEIPIRFREMCSFWVAREAETVVVRGKYYRDRAICLIMTGVTSATATVNTVPRERSLQSWIELSAMKRDLGRLMLPQSDVVRSIGSHFFGRIDDPAFVYLEILPGTKSNTPVLRWSLQRLEMQFELREDGCIVSLDRTGYKLASCQQLPEVISRFTNYIVLERSDPSAERETVLIVPDCDVERTPSGTAHLNLPLEATAPLKSFAYSLHPRLHVLRAESTKSRLHLAAILAARGTLLPDDINGKSGALVALDLVRQCLRWSPLSDPELDKLADVALYTAGFPVLGVSCSILARESARLSVLYPDEDATNLMLDDCVDEYKIQLARGLQRCGVSRLEEEEHFVGARFKLPMVHLVRRDAVIDFDAEQEIFHSVTDALEKAVTIRKGSADGVVGDSLPLHNAGKFFRKSDSLAQQVLGELQDSWKANLQAEAASLTKSVASTTEQLLKLQEKTSAASAKLLCHLVEVFESQFLAVDHPDEQAPGSGAELRLTRRSLTAQYAANQRSKISPSEFIELLWSDAVLDDLLPLFTEPVKKAFRRAAFLLVQLWVMEDKINYLENLLSDPEQVQNPEDLSWSIAQEFARRSWDVEIYPRWLGFEAVSRIRIRPEQARLAKTLIHGSPGGIMQLNMGLGKTRVVLPIVLLHLTQEKVRMVRVFFLTPLLREGLDFMRRTLTASLFRIPVLELPFERTTQVDATMLRSYRLALERCRDLHGFVAVTPEFVLSLALKKREAQLQGGDLYRAFEKHTTIDYLSILDESDALLHPKYELVYAMGDAAPLSSGQSRWEAAHALLRVLACPCEVLREVFASPEVVSLTTSFPSASFQPIRFLRGEAFQKNKARIRLSMAEQLCSEPPHELRWMGSLQKKQRDQLLKAITDGNCTVDSSLLEGLSADPVHQEHVLSLRGLLAYDVLFSALEKRHRVDYGVDKSRKPPRQLAVPFRGSDMPAARAEFSHADSVVVLTTLSFYYSGITWNQLVQAITALLELSLTSAELYYHRWLVTMNQQLDEDEVTRIDNVSKLDVTSNVQQAILEKAFCFSPEAINFWLGVCVFPSEISEFPNRLKQSAWDLASGPTIGFSGTNDFHRMLPLTVRQVLDDKIRTFATNGHMLDVILKSSEVVLLPPPGKMPLWEKVLECAVAQSEGGVRALVDTGALLSGVSNENAAKYLNKHLNASFLAVLYSDSHCWQVLERNGRCLPLGSSPVHERDSFVIFDEAHCRGADMRMQRTAVGLITLGPQLCKDKFMQGAGRMRALGAGQRLEILVVEEIAHGINGKRNALTTTSWMQSSATSVAQDITVNDILLWLVLNTLEGNRLLLPHWTGNGAHFVLGREDGGAPLEDDGPPLDTLYCGRCSDKKLLEADQEARLAKLELGEDLLKRVAICETGSNFLVQSHDEECERETEHERETEEEKEEEVPKLTPSAEKWWDASPLVSAQDVDDVKRAILPGVYSLADVVSDMFSSSKVLSQYINMPTSQVWVTSNFLHAVDGTHIDQYLRLADAILVVPTCKDSPDSALFVLSEFEAERVLQLLHAHPGAACAVTLVNWCFLRTSEGTKAIELATQPAPAPRTHAQLAALQLFGGETKYCWRKQEADRMSSLGQLLRPDSKRAVLELLRMRQTQAQYDMSDLQSVIEQLNITHARDNPEEVAPPAENWHGITLSAARSVWSSLYRSSR
ncbi:hypothetical protein DIPPA_05970 [Diplonema papillatum]|nr:hypothetical protein DIPPA_05970 [Diplonema papillatum]